MVSLKPMTRQMCHEFYREFQNDPAIGHYYEYVYTPEIADSYFERNSVPGKMLFAILVDDQIVGEIKLKKIDFQGKRAQWDKITKGASWDEKTGKYTVSTKG